MKKQKITKIVATMLVMLMVLQASPFMSWAEKVGAQRDPGLGIDRVTVWSDGKLLFRFRNGMEVDG